MKKPNSQHLLAPVAKLIGFRLVKASQGAAVCEMLTSDLHKSAIGRVHGGILCDLADATMGCAFLSQIPSSRKGVTTNLQIIFLKGVRVGQRLRAAAKVLSHGRSVYFMECEIRNGLGELVAKASSTCKVLPKRR